MTTETDTLQILKELAEKGIAPGEEMEQIVQEVGGAIVTEGTGEDELGPMVTTATRGPGYSTVYHTVTGQPSQVSNNMLPAQLRKKLDNVNYPGHGGKRAFTIYDPGFRPPEGTLLCYMHPDSDMRAKCEELGFPMCQKSNIDSPFEQEEHMKNKHSRQWATLERNRELFDEAEDRTIQRGMLAAMERQAGPPVPEVPPPLVHALHAPSWNHTENRISTDARYPLLGL